MVWLWLALGLVLLFLGGEMLVRGAVAVAARLGVPAFLIGLTLVGFGTSMPELVASLQAAFLGAPGIAVGNVVGSNIANILLIVGLAALIAPFSGAGGAKIEDWALIALSAAALLAIFWFSGLGRVGGALMVLVLLAYIVVSYWLVAVGKVEAGEDLPLRIWPLWRGLGVSAIGLVGVVVGAYLLVNSAIVIARNLGVAEAVIGLTVVAVGTSLPELATSVIAAIKKRADISLGNIVGSNIFNAFGILGVTGMVHPIAGRAGMVWLDMAVMTGATVALIALALIAKAFGRPAGLIMLVAYALYIAALALDPARAAV